MAETTENRWVPFNLKEIRYLAWALTRAPATAAPTFEEHRLSRELLHEMLMRTAES